MPSSVIATFYYDGALQELKIVFVSGLVYVYKDVPKAVYLDMKASRSKGIYLNKYIKPVYKYEKLES